MSENAAATVILIVDDYEDGREMSAELLSMRGYTVLTAGTGLAALDVARTGKPHLMLLDLTLPDLDGFEVARRLKADPATAGIAIIMLTAHADAALERSAAAIGCAGFVTKPCMPTELVRRIDAALGRVPAPKPNGREIPAL